MHYMRLTLSLLLFALSCGQTATAELYKWVDEQGQTHYSDSTLDDRK